MGERDRIKLRIQRKFVAGGGGRFGETHQHESGYCSVGAVLSMSFARPRFASSPSLISNL